MEYARWAPQYARIAAEFGYAMERERAAADRLRALFPVAARSEPLARCRGRILGHETVVVGLGPGAGAPPMHLLPPSRTPRTVVAADGAAERCLAAGLVPDLVVTDLDGPVASEVTANARGALVVVHAHGDNGEALDRWVPEFSGELAGSWAGPPTAELLDVGGFTDGDRAAYLSSACRASSVLLWGFDFVRVEEPDAGTRGRKLRKLEFAREDLNLLAADVGPPLLEWRRDGTRRPYAGGTLERSTQ